MRSAFKRLVISIFITCIAPVHAFAQQVDYTLDLATTILDQIHLKVTFYAKMNDAANVNVETTEESVELVRSAFGRAMLPQGEGIDALGPHIDPEAIPKDVVYEAVEYAVRNFVSGKKGNQYPEGWKGPEDTEGIAVHFINALGDFSLQMVERTSFDYGGEYALLWELNDHRLKPVGSRATVETVFFQVSASGALLILLFRLEDGGLKPFFGESTID